MIYPVIAGLFIATIILIPLLGPPTRVRVRTSLNNSHSGFCAIFGTRAFVS